LLTNKKNPNNICIHIQHTVKGIINHRYFHIFSYIHWKLCTIFRAVNTIEAVASSDFLERKKNKKLKKQERKKRGKNVWLTGILFYDYIFPLEKLQLFTNLKEYIK
jgi:hypothetical protein